MVEDQLEPRARVGPLVERDLDDLAEPLVVLRRAGRPRAPRRPARSRRWPGSRARRRGCRRRRGAGRRPSRIASTYRSSYCGPRRLGQVGEAADAGSGAGPVVAGLQSSRASSRARNSPRSSSAATSRSRAGPGPSLARGSRSRASKAGSGRAVMAGGGRRRGASSAGSGGPRQERGSRRRFGLTAASALAGSGAVAGAPGGSASSLAPSDRFQVSQQSRLVAVDHDVADLVDRVGHDQQVQVLGRDHPLGELGLARSSRAGPSSTPSRRGRSGTG